MECNFIEFITVILLLFVIFLLGYLFYLYVKQNMKSGVVPDIDTSDCRCMRQTNANYGFCGTCDSEGFRYGCSTGSSGCRRNCRKVKYSGERCDSCRDEDCSQ